MFARGGFSHVALRAYVQDLIESLFDSLLPEIHEEPAQNIQGGAPGEHFHLTEEEHAFVENLALVGVSTKIYEPVMAGGELALSSAGDCMMAWGGEYAS